WSLPTCSASSRMAFMPVPETDWYDEVSRNRSPNARCSGPSGTSAVMAVQFGFAMRPWWSFAASGLISGITRGTSGSIRNADELSMQTVPFAAAAGSSSRDAAPPHDTSATSTPSHHPSPLARTSISLSRNGIREPAERSVANSSRSSRGKARSSSTRVIWLPTAPVAPTTATRISGPLGSDGRRLAQIELGMDGAHRAIGVLRANDARDPDRGGGDHLDVDPL